MAGIIINQAPVSIAFYCDWCDTDVEISYEECVKKYGKEPYDWERVKMPERCGHASRKWTMWKKKTI